MTNIIPKFNSQKIFFKTTEKDTCNRVYSFLDDWNDSSDFFSVKTSGSTGTPTLHKLSKKMALESAKLSLNYFKITPNSRFALALSAETIGGKMQILRALASDSELYVLDLKRNPIQDICFSIDFISLVPMQIQQIIAENPDHLQFFKSILLGGAPVSAALRQQLCSFSSHFYESYGMTETYSHIAIRKLNGKENEFVALDGIRFSTSDGNLVIHAPQLGIQNLKTHDTVHLISESQFQLIGRTDFAINSGGYKFHPETLEAKLSPLIKHNFFIIGEADLVYGQCVTFYIEEDYTEKKQEYLLKLFKQEFKQYERPKKIYFVAKFQYTSSGKINRLATQQLYLEQ